MYPDYRLMAFVWIAVFFGIAGLGVAIWEIGKAVVRINF